jgi:hypothetical protein
MHLAGLEQQHRSVSARIDQLHVDVNLNALGLTRESGRLHHPYVPAYANTPTHL